MQQQSEKKSVFPQVFLGLFYKGFSYSSGSFEFVTQLGGDISGVCTLVAELWRVVGMRSSFLGEYRSTVALESPFRLGAFHNIGSVSLPVSGGTDAGVIVIFPPLFICLQKPRLISPIKISYTGYSFIPRLPHGQTLSKREIWSEFALPFLGESPPIMERFTSAFLES